MNVSCVGDSITEIAWTVDNPEDSHTQGRLCCVSHVPDWSVFVIFTIVKKKTGAQPVLTNLLIGFLSTSSLESTYVFDSTDMVRCHVCHTSGVIFVISNLSLAGEIRFSFTNQ